MTVGVFKGINGFYVVLISRELSRRAHFEGLAARSGSTRPLGPQLNLRGQVAYTSQALSHCFRRSGQLRFQAVCCPLQATHLSAPPFPRISYLLLEWAVAAQ